MQRKKKWKKCKKKEKNNGKDYIMENKQHNKK